MLGYDGENNVSCSKYILQEKLRESYYAKINVLRVHKTVRPIAGQ